MGLNKKSNMQVENEINSKEECRITEAIESAGYVASSESNDHSSDTVSGSEIEIKQSAREKVDAATEVGSDVDTARDFLPPELTLAPMDYILNSARGEAKSFLVFQVKREKCNDGQTEKERIFFRMEADINPKWMIAQEKQQRKIAETKKSVAYKSRPKQRIFRPKSHLKTCAKIDENKQKTSSKDVNKKLPNKKGKNVQLPPKNIKSKDIIKKPVKAVASIKAAKKEKTSTKAKMPVKGVPQGRSIVKPMENKKKAVTIEGKKTTTIPKIQKNKQATSLGNAPNKKGLKTAEKQGANKSRKTPVNKLTGKTATKVQSSSGRQQNKKPTTTNKKTARTSVASNAKGAPTASSTVKVSSVANKNPGQLKKTARTPVASNARAAPTASSNVKASSAANKNQGQQKSSKTAPSSQRAANGALRNETKTEATSKRKPSGMRPEPTKTKVPIKPALIQKPEHKKIPKPPPRKTKLEDIKPEQKKQEVKKDKIAESVDEPKTTEIPFEAEVRQQLNEGPVPLENEPKVNSEDLVDINEIKIVVQPSVESPTPIEIESLVTESVTEPVTEPHVPEPVTEPYVPEPVTESVTEPVTESHVTEPVIESVTEPHVSEPVIESVTVTVTKSVPEPVTKSVPEPVTKSVLGPVTKSVPEPVAEAEVIPTLEQPGIESVNSLTTVVEEDNKCINEPLVKLRHMCNDCGYIVQEHVEVSDEGDVGETPENNEGETEKSKEPELCQKCCKNVIKVAPEPNECINCLGYLGYDTQFELHFDSKIRNLKAICSICKEPLKIDQKECSKPPVVLREARGTLSAAFAEMVRRLERFALENDSPLGAAYSYVTSYHDEFQPCNDVLNVRPRPRACLGMPARPRFTYTSGYSQEFKPLPLIKPESFFGRRKFSGLGQVRM